MTVNVTRDAINVREKLAELDKPTGIAGEAMLRAETPQEQFNLIGAGRRNLIINGAMQVAQRGTSFTSAGYSLDRMFFNASGGTATVTQEEATLGQEVAGQFQYWIKVNTTVGNNYCGIQQRVENVRSLPEGYATLSFWVKGTNPASGKYLVQAQRLPAGASGATLDVPLDTTYSVTSEWTKKTFTFYVPPLANTVTENGGSQIYFTLGAQQGPDNSTAAWELNITGVQLEVGKVATPFEHRSYGEELALCSRYTHVLKPEQAFGRYRASYSDTGTSCNTFYEFPVEMRSLPTLTSNNMSSSTFQCYSETDGGFYNPTSAFTLGESSKRHVYMSCNTATATAGAVGMWRWNNNPSASMVFDAEL